MGLFTGAKTKCRCNFFFSSSHVRSDPRDRKPGGPPPNPTTARSHINDSVHASCSVQRTAGVTFLLYCSKQNMSPKRAPGEASIDACMSTNEFLKLPLLPSTSTVIRFGFCNSSPERSVWTMDWQNFGRPVQSAVLSSAQNSCNEIPLTASSVVPFKPPT